MGSPARLPRAQRRAQLLDAAHAQFIHDGYHRTSMDAIAAAAGVTKPVLYQHFPSKEALYLEVVHTLGKNLIAEIDELAQVDGSAQHRVDYGLRRYTEILAGVGPSLRLLESAEIISEEVEREVAEIVDHSGHAIASVIRRYRQIPAFDAEILGQGLAGLARASARHLTAASAPEARDHVIQMLLTFVINGLGAYPQFEDLQSESGGRRRRPHDIAV